MIIFTVKEIKFFLINYIHLYLHDPKIQFIFKLYIVL